MARPSKPWYRGSKNTWYVTLEGKKVSLKVRGRENEKLAIQAWHRLFAGMPLESPEIPLPSPIVPQAVPMVKAEAVSVREVINGFLADCQDGVGRTTLRIRRYFLLPFADAHGELAADALTPTLAEAYSRKSEWKDATRHDFLKTLAMTFTWAERSRLIDRTPLVGLRKPPKASRGSQCVVSAEMVNQFLARADAEFAALVRFLWLTGCRPSEAGNLTVDDVRWQEGCAILQEHKTKHKGKVRVIYLSDEAMAVLREQREKHRQGYLFHRPTGGKWTSNGIGKKFERMSLKTGVKVIPYGLRHTFATDALANGIPDAQVAALMGHSGTAMLHRHYSHLTARSQALREALGRVR